MKWNLDDIPIFIAVVDHRGITAAATALAMPKSTVSTALSRLEAGLGLRLIERSSRSLRVTPEGERFYRQAQMIMDQAREADATASGMSAEPSGRLTAALPPAFVQEIVAPRLMDFFAAYPAIDLDMMVTTHGLDLIRDQVDVAVVVGPLADSELIARTLIAGPLTWVTSPGYLARNEIGTSLADIRSHIRICEKRYGQARLPVHLNGEATHLDLAQGIAHVNNPLAVRRAVEAGAGLSLLPRHYCRDQIAAGTLVEVCRFITFDIAASTLSVVFPGRRLVSPRVRVFVDFLTEACRQASA